MRGKGNRETGHSDKIGITPAHAGKSRRFNVMSLENWDHPRTCGEKDPAAEIGDAVTGSPPHMRGKGTGVGTGAVAGGITPAHAGKRLRKP